VIKTVEQKPAPGEMLKPAELIELRGTGPLTLQDRRVFNLLLENAWGAGIASPEKEFTISTAQLKPPGDTTTRVADTVERLMRTIVRTRDADGGETRLQLLSTNTIRTTANGGTLSYSFPRRLAELLADSSIFAKLDLQVMRSFSSKYAFSLYEQIARRAKLRWKFTEELDIDGMRELLGVEAGKLEPFKNLQRKAVDPAVSEVNAIAPYQVTIAPKKSGRKVTGFVMSWAVKDTDGMKEAFSELQRPRIGRKERLEGTAELPLEYPETIPAEHHEPPHRDD
jgi:hypothetical protein